MTLLLLLLPLVFDSSVYSLGAREADDLDVLTRISETDILMDNTLTGEQKDMLSALLDPLGDDDGGVDLIGEEIVIPDNTFNGLTEVRACVCGGGQSGGEGGGGGSVLCSNRDQRGQ